MSSSGAEEFRGRRVLVTGATGFIGRHLVRALLSAGVRPHLLVRPSSAAAATAEAPACTVHAADLAAPGAAAVLRAIAPEVVFHLGGYTDPARDPAHAALALAANAGATAALAGAALETGACEAFVAAGTSEEYGHQPPPFREDMPPAPLSPYSASKAAATLWLGMLHRAHGFPAVVVRPFLCYGPGQQPPKLVPTAIAAALDGRDFPMTSGAQMRELTYVGDVVEGLLAAARTPAARGLILNLGSGAEQSVLDIVERVYALAGGSGRPRPGALPDRPGDMQRFAADTRRAAEVLGWRARTALDEGLAETIRWTREAGGAPVPLAP